MNYAGVARNSGEREQALRLAAESFSPAGSSPDVAVLRKAFLVHEHPGYTDDSPIVVCAADGTVAGSAFLIGCTLPLGGRLLQGVFISSVSVAESWRGQGLSVLLMEAAIDTATSRGVDIAMLIARRAVDGYYTRFGFWGVAQYSRVTLKLTTLPVNTFPEMLFDFRPVGTADLKACAILHAENYENFAGYCLRKPEMWRYILRKLAYLGMRFDVITINGEIEGYAIHDGQGNLHEVATRPEGPTCGARNFLEAYVPGGESVTLHIPPAHPFLSQLEGADVSLTVRECPYGGHMARLLSPALIDSLSDEPNPKSGYLSFAQTAKALRLSRVTDLDSAAGAGMRGSFNISLLDQI